MSVPPIGSISGVSANSPLTQATSNQQDTNGNAFSRLLNAANNQQFAAESAIDQLATGKTDSLHNVVISAAKADLSFRLVLEMRNKLIESYEEIMRMQV